MNNLHDLVLDPSIAGRFDLLGKLNQLAQMIYDGFSPAQPRLSAKLLQAMGREFIVLDVADATHLVSLELTMRDLANPQTVQKRVSRAWQTAACIRQSA